MIKRVSKVILIVLMVLVININTVFAADIDLDRINEIIDIIKLNYKDDVSDQQLIDGAIKGMLETLDPHSVYLTDKEYQDLVGSLDSHFFGIGVQIEKVNKYVQVIGVIESSPAQKVGLKPGDKFVTVDDKDVYDIALDVFVSMVRGSKGTNVKVGVIRENVKEPLEFKLVRDEIQVKSVEQEILQNNIGYIEISSFNSDTFDEVRRVIKEFNSRNINKIIIDLRGNSGGYFDQVVNICRLLIPKGPVVHVAQNNMPLETYNSYLENSKYKLAVLVDGGSASASEILAGAVKDREAGVLIGTKTYGKGTVQTFYRLDNGDYVKLSYAKYLTPNEISIDGIGITPDIIVENSITSFAPINFSKNIYLGKIDDNVLGIEQRLLKLGYTNAEPDNIYDYETSEVVKKLKKEFGMLPNNIITVAFQRSLEKKATEVEKFDLQLEKAIEVLNK